MHSCLIHWKFIELSQRTVSGEHIPCRRSDFRSARALVQISCHTDTKRIDNRAAGSCGGLYPTGIYIRRDLIQQQGGTLVILHEHIDHWVLKCRCIDSLFYGEVIVRDESALSTSS